MGGSAHLIGLCQGGWMCAMYAARFPAKVRSLVLAGAPIDTAAGSGQIKNMAHTLPMSFFEELVTAGGGLMHGEMMIAGWKGMHPEKQWEKYLDLYKNIEDKEYVERAHIFESWFEHPVDMPGAFYLQVVQQLFKENRLTRGEFVGLNQRLSLKDITCPVYLLAGREDDITPAEQVFHAERYLGTPKDQIVKVLAPGGHIGLFMGTETLAEYWPRVARVDPVGRACRESSESAGRASLGVPVRESRDRRGHSHSLASRPGPRAEKAASRHALSRSLEHQCEAIRPGPQKRGTGGTHFC